LANCCEHIKDILNVEQKLIKQHIIEHKWCNGFDNRNDAIIDFVQKYAWLMREVFCGVMCPYRNKCEVSDVFRKAFLEDISDGEIEEFIKLDYKDNNRKVVKIKLQILKHDLKAHKWLNKIDNYEDAVKDFLSKFGWLIYEMYRITNKEYEGN